MVEQWVGIWIAIAGVVIGLATLVVTTLVLVKTSRLARMENTLAVINTMIDALCVHTRDSLEQDWQSQIMRTSLARLRLLTWESSLEALHWNTKRYAGRNSILALMEELFGMYQPDWGMPDGENFDHNSSFVLIQDGDTPVPTDYKRGRSILLRRDAALVGVDAIEQPGRSVEFREVLLDELTWLAVEVTASSGSKKKLRESIEGTIGITAHNQ